jgi:hypothetical protein
LGQSICEWNMYLFKFKNCPYTPRYNVIIRWNWRNIKKKIKKYES